MESEWVPVRALEPDLGKNLLLQERGLELVRQLAEGSAWESEKNLLHLMTDYR